MSPARQGDEPPGRPPHAPAARARRAAVRMAICLLAAALWPAPAAADDVQLWPTLTVFTPTVDGWRASAEVHTRWTENLGAYNRTVYRLNGGRAVTARLELFGGWELTVPAARGVFREQRLWEQAEYTVRSGDWVFSNRARLEQRFVQGADRMASRLRYRFRAQHPLGHTRWIVGGSAELWVHLTTSEPVGLRGIDQHRVALTAFRVVSRYLSIEPGYLFIEANLPPPQPNRRSHVATLQLTARF